MVTCEHAGRQVPRAYTALFKHRAALLHSHRGWDWGALDVARTLSEALTAPLYFTTTTRLLIDLNRSIGHRQLFSEITRPLPKPQRDEIVDLYYRPHRDTVEQAIAQRIAAGHRVLHIASHSFAPVLDGRERLADVAWLYDPRRAGERAFASRWISCFAQFLPDLRRRRNYPYRGRADGLTAALRKRHPDQTYMGIELEVNQRCVGQGGATWNALRSALAASLAQALAGSPTG
jgi:predicted N-formylglutamate amidohydrolase